MPRALTGAQAGRSDMNVSTHTGPSSPGCRGNVRAVNGRAGRVPSLEALVSIGHQYCLAKTFFLSLIRFEVYCGALMARRL